eukprot:m.99072 g.99072  ORF g.99072 m.99072 type:complete len:542 (+) comp37030_c0_seq2:385-2010(+)
MSNKITTVPGINASERLSNCRNLETICLNNNSLTPTGLGTYMFSSLSTLNILDLSDNPDLNEIGPNALNMAGTTISSISYIYLRGIKMKMISSKSGIPDAYKRNPSLKVCLSESDLTCNCSLEWTCPLRKTLFENAFDSQRCRDFNNEHLHDCPDGDDIYSWCCYHTKYSSCPSSWGYKKILSTSLSGAVGIVAAAIVTVVLIRRYRRRSRSTKRNTERGRLLEESFSAHFPQQKKSASRSGTPSSTLTADEPGEAFLQSFFLTPDNLTQKEKIGEGGSGVVYKAQWNEDIVAVKELRSRMLLEGEKDEFRREALLMSKLRHPNIVLLMGICLDDGCMCIVTEFMAQGSVSSILRPQKGRYQPLDQNRILKMLLDTAKGMAYLHRQEPPIIHRDLKSGNLLVDQHWNVKVADFGVAKILTHFQQDLTHTRLPGTLLWTAPELMTKSPVLTKMADVYSFGIVIWEFLCAPDAPFSHLKSCYIFELVEKVRKGDRPIIHDNCPEDLRQLMERCWQHNHKKRPEFSHIIGQLKKNLVDTSSASE